MEILRFNAPFKPKGNDYTYIALWNRYVKTPILLIASFIPTFVSIYFLFTTEFTIFSWLFIVIMFYPLFNLIQFLFTVWQHLRFRSPFDTAQTEFTLMNNGILIERREHEHMMMKHWEDFNQLYELKNYLILYNNNILTLVLDKRCMADNQKQEIRQYILNHLPANRKISYKKSNVF